MGSGPSATPMSTVLAMIHRRKINFTFYTVNRLKSRGYEQEWSRAFDTPLNGLSRPGADVQVVN